MPPKKITKSQLAAFSPSASEESKAEEEPDKNLDNDFVDVDNYKANMKTLSSTRTMIAILVGVFCGIVNINQLSAALLYAIVQLLASPLIALSVKTHSNYFLSWTDILSGIAQSTLMFVCSWMISYNLVYTL